MTNEQRYRGILKPSAKAKDTTELAIFYADTLESLKDKATLELPKITQNPVYLHASQEKQGVYKRLKPYVCWRGFGKNGWQLLREVA